MQIFFFPVCDRSFHYLDSTFHKAENSGFNEVQFFSSFLDHAFGVVPKMSSPNLRSFLLCFLLSSRSLTVVPLSFIILVNFCEECNVCVYILFLGGWRHVDVQLFHHHLLKVPSLFHCTTFAFVRGQMAVSCGSTSGLSIMCHSSILIPIQNLFFINRSWKNFFHFHYLLLNATAITSCPKIKSYSPEI